MDDINKGDMIRANVNEVREAYGFVVDIDTEAKKATVLVAVEVDLTVTKNLYSLYQGSVRNISRS